jgi:iron(III) transport system substrate-binding protein
MKAKPTMFIRAWIAIAPLLLIVGQAFPVTAASADNRQNQIEGAKKEGQVVVWHNGPLSEPMLKPFTSRYPFVKVKGWRTRGDDAVIKTIEEAKAGIHNYDLLLIGEEEIPVIMSASLLAKYEWPNTKGWTNQPGHDFYRAIIATAFVPAFNSKIIPAAEWPKDWDDLKDPKWQGKAIISSSGADTPLFTAYLWRTKDQELNWEKSFAYWREVIQATKPKIGRGFAGPTELLATGAAAVMPMTVANTALRMIWQGAPVKLLPVKRIIARNSVLAIMNRAPHPNAARLFADYLTSKEGLTLYADTRGMLVNSPELGKLTKTNKSLADFGITFEDLPPRFVTEENNTKASNFWFSELGVKGGGKGAKEE